MKHIRLFVKGNLNRYVNCSKAALDKALETGDYLNVEIVRYENAPVSAKAKIPDVIREIRQIAIRPTLGKVNVDTGRTLFIEELIPEEQ